MTAAASLKGKNSYIERIKSAERTSSYLSEAISLNKSGIIQIKNETSDNKKLNSRVFLWKILFQKHRYKDLGLYTKFDHFLSKFKEQIKMIGSYYIYFNNGTFSWQKSII